MAANKLIASACILFLLTSCGNPGHVVVCLFDVSGTTKANRQAYLSDFANVDNQLGSGDDFWGLLITESSLANGSPIHQEFKRLNVFQDNEVDYRESMDLLRKDLLQRVTSYVSEKSTPRTTIFDSLALAQKILQSDSESLKKQKELIIFSDMLEDDGEYDFAHMKLSPSVIERIVKEQKASGQMPNFKGVNIYVTGATSDPKIARSRIREVQSFWTTYFRASGSDLPNGHYSTSLLTFKLAGD